MKRRRKGKAVGKTAKAQATEFDVGSDEDDAAGAVDDDDVRDDAAGSCGDDTETSLYGQWQVQRHVPVPLVDGQVPVNAHGNFELWSRWWQHVTRQTSHLTRHTSHITKHHALTPARASYHLPPNACHIVVEGSKETAVAALLQVMCDV